jgi:hypothetical protein
MWEMVFVEWENYNNLDKIRDVPTRPLVSIKKLAFWLPFEFEKKQLENLIQNFLAKIITIHINQQRVEDDLA